METTKIFTDVLKGILFQLPIFLASLAGLIVVIVCWRRSPAASLWAVLAFGLSLVLCIVIPVVQQVMWRMMMERAMGFDTRNTINMALTVVWSLLRAVSYVFLLIGVYAGRKSASVAPVAARSQF